MQVGYVRRYDAGYVGARRLVAEAGEADSRSVDLI